MNRIIWVDIGTHFGQEYESIFGNNIKFFLMCLKRLVSFLILRRGFWFKRGDFGSFLKARHYLRTNRRQFSFYFIEANLNIIRSRQVYMKGDKVFNVAIIGNEKEDLKVTKLFLPGNDKLSEGSSIFRDKKDFPGTFDANNFIDVLGISAQAFFGALKLQLENNFGKDYKVLIRLNCEGVEDDVIYAARHQFGKNLKLVCGSIKDVRICKGEDRYKALLNFMQQNSIPYVSFSPGMSSWLSSYLAIKKIMTSL